MTIKTCYLSLILYIKTVELKYVTTQNMEWHLSPKGKSY